MGLLAVIAACHLMVAQSVQSTTQSSIEPSAHLGDFQVLEFRRYTIKEGEREHFAQYFDTYFPEALQELGTIVFCPSDRAEVFFIWFQQAAADEFPVSKELNRVKVLISASKFSHRSWCY
jgi:hypothetical protein